MSDSETIYMDCAATTPVRPEVLEGMLPYFGGRFANASSIHYAGQTARGAVERSREIVAACLGAGPREIFFTSGGTESDNLAVKGVARARRGHGRHLILSAIEHPAVLDCAADLAEEGYEFSFLPVDRCGVVEVGALRDAMRPDTILVSVMLANNETGTVQPVEKICAIAAAAGIPVHTDAVQAIGKIPVDIGRLGVDLLTLSAHKFHGPKGVGALYAARGAVPRPLLSGGGQERRLRPGTENVPAIVGLGIAIELACREREAEAARLARLRDRLEQGIRAGIGGCELNGHRDKRLPNILNMSFAGATGEALTVALDTRGIAVSSRSACASGSLEPSHVLHAMGVDGRLALSSVRFSLGRDSTAAQVDRVVDVLADCVARIRRRGAARAGGCGPGCNCGSSQPT